MAAAIWGFAFVAQRLGMQHVGPFVFNAVRFALGGLTLIPFILLRKPNGTARSFHLPGAALAGLVLFLAISLQQIGIVYTTAGKAGFITGLYVIIVPLIGLVLRQRIGGNHWLAVGLAVIGMYLLSVKRGFQIEKGDLFVFCGAIVWAVHVQILGWLAPRNDSYKLAAIQYAVCAALSFIAAAIFEDFSMPGILSAGLPILYGGVMSVGIGFTMQVVAQRNAPPTHVAVLLSLETVIAVFGGWLLLNEILTLREFLGCALVLAAMLAAQLGREVIYSNVAKNDH